MTKQLGGFEKAFNALTAWSEGLTTYPGFKEFKRKSIARTLLHGETDSRDPADELSDFAFPDEINKQHEFIIAFLHLHTTWQAIVDTEYYFRRFPFSGLPIDKDTYLRYTCESYFSRIYEFSERLKKCLNALNEVIPHKVDAGSLIKQFGRDFREEIKQRNLVNHHNRFEEIMIDRITLEGLMARGGGKGWEDEQRRTYRRASKEWAERVRRRAARVKEYLDAVGELVVSECEFVSKPPFGTAGGLD